MRSSLSARSFFPAACILLLALAGCSTTQDEAGSVRLPSAVQADIERMLPAQVSDRAGWARDIQVAFAAQGIPTTRENLCSVLAVTEQESTFQAEPRVPGLGRIARAEIDRRAASVPVPSFLVDAALRIPSSSGKSYADRLSGVKTEKELSELFDEFIDMAPLGRQLFGSFNPVRTGGPMQVSIDFARANAQNYPYPIKDDLRSEVFTRRGGMYFGIAHLLGYPVSYDRPLYRFADFNAGWYASRNAAFQSAVSQLSGVKLALDGDLVTPGSVRAGETELAVRVLARSIGMTQPDIRRDLERGAYLDFEETELYEKVMALTEKTTGKPVARAILPGIKLESPKITRDLTTAWFANRVDERWTKCMARP